MGQETVQMTETLRPGVSKRGGNLEGKETTNMEKSVQEMR